ncbi:MAG: thiamine phosphate synthase, partial [Verrucomicrobiota bacterium]|nr:thiamine phosphate synthase [Verrucomicrobiota bacterium]
MPLNSAQRHSIMCLTRDSLPLTHIEQAARLCAAGARWIQLRMKNAEAESWHAAAREVVGICRAHGALCIVNDNIDVALASGADGVH